MATGRPAAPPEPALPPGPDAPVPELQGGALGVRGVAPPWLESGAAALAGEALLRAVSMAKALGALEPSSAGEVHGEGLLRLPRASGGLMAAAGASAAA